VTKLAAEHLCRMHFLAHGLNCVILRTSRFFPENDDTLTGLSGENLKANEFLYRRLSVEDAARAHVAALEKAPAIGFGAFIISAPTPFNRQDAATLRSDACAVISRLFPDAGELYKQRGWSLPESISRVYDSSRARSELGFVCQTDFAAILEALRRNTPLPFVHDPDFESPVVNSVAF
jgi:nucleoside-diphosphate-sugar epimerase